MTEEEYELFHIELSKAPTRKMMDIDKDVCTGIRAGSKLYFEGCLPLEIIAMRGGKALLFGPLRPIGLHDPRTGNRPFAVVQLRQDNLIASMYNMVGFQTNLVYTEQERIFRLIPGLGSAKFVRLGHMHRNTFIASPKLLQPSLHYNQRHSLLFAGQITGVEGYLGSIATGLLAGINAARYVLGEDLLSLPTTTMLGALCQYITHADMHDFQPMKANYGLLPLIDGDNHLSRSDRNMRYYQRSIRDLKVALGKGS
jgi:methylenetetrahydrofolate--tRNA-(uracil-5-)-methyltransferase